MCSLSLLSALKTTGLNDKAVLPRSFEIGFRPIIRGLSAPTPRIWYGRYQLEQDKISNKFGFWHSPASLRRATAGATTSGWPDYHLHDIHAPSGCWSQFVFCPPPFPSRSGLRRHPYLVFQFASLRWRRWSAFSLVVVKFGNQLPASVVTAPSVNIFKKRLEQVWAELFPHIPHWLNTNHPNPQPERPTAQDNRGHSMISKMRADHRKFILESR